MKIQICGLGCSNCAKIEQIIAETISKSGVDAEVEKITDLQEMVNLGVISTPAVIIDGQIKCMGKVPPKKEVVNWIF